MRIKLTFLAILISLTSCQNTELECTGFMEKRTLKEILYEQELNYTDLYHESGLNNFESDLESFFDDVVKLKWVVLSDKNKELKKYECSASLNFEIEPKLKEFILKNSNMLNEVYYKLLVNEGTPLDIDYTLQGLEGENKDGEFLVSTLGNDELSYVAIAYLIMKERFEEKAIKKKNEERFTTEEVDISDSSYDKCFKYIDYKTMKDGESIFLLKLNISDNKVTGTYDYMPNYADAASFGGEIKGTLDDYIVNGTWFQYGEGSITKIPIKIEILSDQALLTVDNNNGERKTLQSVDCNNMSQVIKFMK